MMLNKQHYCHLHPTIIIISQSHVPMPTEEVDYLLFLLNALQRTPQQLNRTTTNKYKHQAVSNIEQSVHSVLR